MCSYELKQTKKGALMSFKRIYIYGVHLGLLPQTSLGGTCVLVFHLYLYMFWWVSCLRVNLVSIFISTSSIVPACLIPVGYVRKICITCLHVQFLDDMCTTCIGSVPAYSIPRGRCTSSVFFLSDLYGICACIFNSRRICAWFLYCMGFVFACSFPVGYVHDFCIVWELCLHIQFLGDMCISYVFWLTWLFLDERSTGDVGGLIGEYNSIEKCFGDDSDLPWSLDSVRPTGEGVAYWGFF